MKTLIEIKMREKFYNLRKFLEDTNTTRRALKAAIAKLNANRKDFAPEYQKEFIDPQIADLEARMRGSRQAEYEKARQLLQDLQVVLEEKQAQPLDLANPALSNALKLIELSGKKMDPDIVRKIVEPFAGDQNALRALRTVFQAQGLTYDGGISGRPGMYEEGMLYEPAAAIENMNQYAYDVWTQGGSVNSLSSQLAKLAAKEKIDFPAIIDDQGILDAVRAGAGLPETEPK